MNIEVTRASEDRLSDEIWKFTTHVANDVVRLTFRYYAKRSRPSTRHKMRVDKQWDRHEQRTYWSTLTFRDVPSPSDVIDEAMSKISFSVELPAGDVVGWKGLTPCP